jgi:hypothetical protein
VPVGPPTATPQPTCRDPQEFWDPYLNRCRLPTF